MKQNSNPWKKLESKQIYENPWIQLEEDKVINPGGGISYYGKIIFKNYAIGIVPLDQEKHTWLVGQWRYPHNEYTWEIPMGGGPVNVDRIESARRELKEETGLSASKWTEILRMHTSNSVTNEVGYAYLAENLQEGEPEFEETEDLEIIRIPFKEAVEMCMDGRIVDSLSLAAILKLSRTL